ncbi:hypothetical protein E1264_27340 [Actinomadura sp. KC216]|uniref:hypothetical protein n=1 Tax=Actinomadura sp. KC216 TaxID=2530370 RepID=UPI0010445B26|nr:hypothetical protein [Actinomadura sp. KC216]TDB83709.1 hypothetical protein E1264_27340 [Actinomadura sp. KC216]
MPEPQAAPSAASCPVCGLPAGAGARCADCGWTLRTPWRLGHGDAAGFQADLDAACLAADLRAAARLGGDWRDHATLLRGVPDDAAWAAARDAAQVPIRPAGPVVAAAIDRRADGARLAILEAGPDGLTATLVDHLVRAEEPGETRCWTELLPMLSADPAERAFQLAGAQHGLDRSALEPALAAALGEWTRRLPPARIAICRAPGWPLPELATRLLAPETAAEPGALAAGPGSATAEPGALAGLLAEIAAARPIRTGYGLLVARVGPEPARVGTELSTLLPAGARGGAAEEITVYRAPGMNPLTTLAVCTVERPPRLIDAWRATLPAGPAVVRAVLDGPERVRLTEPAGLDSVSLDLPDILADLPTWFEPPPPLLELVCLLELNGPAGTVRRRRELLAGLFDLLATEMADRVRAAVVGYTDHAFRGRTILDVVPAWRPEPPAAARTALDRLPDPVEPFAAGAAPLEDALDAVAGGGPPARAPRVLLTVAGRPPHPLYSDVSGLRPVDVCPLHRDWAAALARLPASRRITVLDRVPETPAPVWRALGEHGLLGLDGAAPRPLAAVLGLLPAAPVPFPLPLAHPL